MKLKQLTESQVTAYWGPITEDLLMEGPLDVIDKDKAKQEKIAEKNVQKVQKIIKYDLSNKCAKAKFYINHNYAKPKDQTAWRKDLQTWSANLKKTEAEHPENYKTELEKFNMAVGNAIVVDESDMFIRRGLQILAHSGEFFVPGKTDKVLPGYFVGDYKYKASSGKAGGKSSSGGASNGGGRGASSKLNETNVKRFKELADLLGVIKVYDSEDKEIELKDVTLENILSTTIVVGTVKTPAKQWLAAAKKKKLI